MNKNNENKITHGLLLEDFKQNLLNLISNHGLDVQSKALVMDYINMQIQNLATQQSQKELEEYKQSLKDAEKADLEDANYRKE